jgi:hypothetical protein
VYALARYNLTASPDTAINITEGGLPFYILNKNLSDGFSASAAGASTPRSIAFDNSANTFWVTDSNDEVIYHFDSSGSNLSDGFKTSSSGARELRGIAFDPTDNSLWLTDTADNFIYHFNSAGVNQSDGIGAGSAGSSEPSTITFDTRDNSFWIFDSVDNFVYHFDSSGSNLSDGFKTAPFGSINIRGISFDKRDNGFWISDYADGWIYHLNSSKDNQTDGFRYNSSGADTLLGVTFDTRDNSLWSVDWNDDFIYHFSNGQNPQISPQTLEAGESWLVNWSLNVSSPLAESYFVDVLFNSSYGAELVPENSTLDMQVNLVDITVPSVTSLTETPSDPATYSAGATYQFNATIIDNLIIESVILEFNGVNYTASNVTAEVYNVSLTNLAVGSYSYRWFANDSVGNANNTETGSYTVSSAPSTPAGPSGGGGGGSTTTPAIKFIVRPESYSRTMEVDETETDNIQITNQENNARDFNIRVDSVDNIISFEEETVRINAKETKEIEFRISSPKEPGIYTGKIIVTTGNTRKEVLVVINVEIEGEKSLFDISMIIPRSHRTIKTGGGLIAQINLLQMGVKKGMDVTLEYVVKDFEGKIHLIESETLYVYDQKTIEKEFDTHELVLGDYVLGAELKYPEGVAVASSQFSVAEEIPGALEGILLFIPAILALSAVLVVTVLMIRRYKNMLRKIKKK